MATSKELMARKGNKNNNDRDSGVKSCVRNIHLIDADNWQIVHKQYRQSVQKGIQAINEAELYAICDRCLIESFALTLNANLLR